ncbi:MAG: hypothetical protein KME07_03830 [Pegethrix bostrychoides GSE-TBD4-15B]|jgi:ADP-heptose:LPS heptosyltransferase|uniref:Uncharacterized protein n=1 Tax=Pegethrix bostrychoides GSE-TBD4-15B TaxID=2839662 RepID=A0A951P7P5_9CYAN|nr:hypothetical protein [Pegethrix bostrychoides GSE-TBD4-15B]
MSSTHIPKSILLVDLLGGIGDLVIALTAIHTVARAYPRARLIVLTFAPGAQLLDADPAISAVLLAFSGQKRQCVEQVLAAGAFDLIISDTSYDGIAELIHAATPPRAITARAQPADPDLENLALLRLVAPRNPEELTAQLRQSLEQLGQDSIGSQLRQLTWAEIADLHLQVYQRI